MKSEDVRRHVKTLAIFALLVVAVIFIYQRATAMSRLPVHGASSVHVESGDFGMGGSYDARVDFERKGASFDVTIDCAYFKTHASRTTKVPAGAVDAFLDVLASHRPTHGEHAACAWTDDHPSISVTIDEKTTVHINDCARQWSMGDLPLDDAFTARFQMSRHADINAAYATMMKAAGVRECEDEAKRASDAKK